MTHAELDLWRPVILATMLLTGIPAATAPFCLESMDAACCDCPLSWHNSDCLDCAGPAQAPLQSYICTSAAQATFCLETIDREEFSDAYAGVDLHIYGQTVDFGKDSIVIPITLQITDEGVTVHGTFV